ncbi:MAG: hypothetical protein OHK0041_17380 [Anaerolineales bacterium]
MSGKTTPRPREVTFLPPLSMPLTFLDRASRMPPKREAPEEHKKTVEKNIEKLIEKLSEKEAYAASCVNSYREIHLAPRLHKNRETIEKQE